MAVKIRLRRTGARNAGSFRVVAADGRSPRDGRFLENLGWYHPRREGVNFSIDEERVAYWKANGAVLSDTVRNLMNMSAKAETPAAAAEPVEDGAPADVPEAPGGSEDAGTADEVTDAAVDEPAGEADGETRAAGVAAEG